MVASCDGLRVAGLHDMAPRQCAEPVRLVRIAQRIEKSAHETREMCIRDSSHTPAASAQATPIPCTDPTTEAALDFVLNRVVPFVKLSPMSGAPGLAVETGEIKSLQ